MMMVGAVGLGSPVLAAELGPIALGGAQSTDSDPTSYTTLAQAPAEEAETTVVTRTEVATTETVEEFSSPISLSIGYALMSDYVFRGINFSEPDGEGREMPNHQLSTSIGFDLGALGLGDFGTIGFDTWFEWYAGQKMIDPDLGGQNLQEVDYIIWWTYSIEPIMTDLKLGYTFYLFPNLAHTLRQDGARGNNNDDRTHEYWFSLAHNDAWMWKWLLPDNEDGVLNPSFYFAHDLGAIGGVWMEFGLSHSFDIPGIEGLSFTPGWTVHAQCDYWKHGFFLAGETFSGSLDYDLTSLLKLPPWAGSIVVSGKLYFFDAWGNFQREGSSNNPSIRGQDEFYGGMAVTWSWGG